MDNTVVCSNQQGRLLAFRPDAGDRSPAGFTGRFRHRYRQRADDSFKSTVEKMDQHRSLVGHLPTTGPAGSVARAIVLAIPYRPRTARVSAPTTVELAAIVSRSRLSGGKILRIRRAVVAVPVLALGVSGVLAATLSGTASSAPKKTTTIVTTVSSTPTPAPSSGAGYYAVAPQGFGYDSPSAP